jgi:hypothetical protein
MHHPDGQSIPNAWRRDKIAIWATDQDNVELQPELKTEENTLPIEPSFKPKTEKIKLS